MFTFEEVTNIMEKERNNTLRSCKPNFAENSCQWLTFINAIKRYFRKGESKWSQWKRYRYLKKHPLVQAIKRTERDLWIKAGGVEGEITPFTIPIEDEFVGNNMCYANAMWVAYRRQREGLHTNAVCGIERSPEGDLSLSFDVLHCVVEKNGMINDMFRGCAFSQKLFEAIFCFEELASVASDQLYIDSNFRYNNPSYLPKQVNPNYYLLSRHEYMRRIRYVVKNKNGQTYQNVYDIPLPKEEYHHESPKQRKTSKQKEEVKENKTTEQERAK